MLKYVHNTKILHYLTRVIIFLCLAVHISAFFFRFSVVANSYYCYALNGIINNSSLQIDDNTVYVTSFSKNTLEINYINNNTIDKRTIKVTGEIKSVATNNGAVYAISYSNNRTYLNRYTYHNDTLNAFIINSTSINSDYKFSVEGDRLYIAETESYDYITCYTIYGEKLYSFSVDNTIDYFTSNNTLYIFTYNQIYTVDTSGNYQPVPLLNTSDIRANLHICDNTVFDYNGNIINLQDNTLISTSITGYLNGGIVNNYYCKYSLGNIYGYDKNGNQHLLYSTNAGNKVQMCSLDNRLYILSENKELYILEENQLAFPQADNSNTATTQAPATNSSTATNKPQTHTGSNPNKKANISKEESFSINSYYVDRDKNIIWNIPSDTTITEFKKNLTCNGYTLEFYSKENVKKTSGKIGTGFTMIVKHSNTEHSRYTISVKGDLSGEGTVSKSDVQLLSKYLMGAYTLSNEQYASGDCNNDNIINGVDLLKIAKNNL